MYETKKAKSTQAQREFTCYILQAATPSVAWPWIRSTEGTSVLVMSNHSRLNAWSDTYVQSSIATTM